LNDGNRVCIVYNRSYIRKREQNKKKDIGIGKDWGTKVCVAYD